ncbi:protein dpy-30 homolog, partial [Gryllus bimaculatus]
MSAIPDPSDEALSVAIGCELFSYEAKKIVADELLQVPSDEDWKQHMTRLDLLSLPNGQYLDITVVPILLLGLTALAEE